MMQFQIRINCGAEVYFVGHEKGDHFLLNPPTDSGRWKIDVLELESRMTELLSARKFGGVVRQYVFRFEIADFEKWGAWFAPDGNRVTYRPKSGSVESVGQLRWRDVKDLSPTEQFRQLKSAIARSIGNVATTKRRPKGFDANEFLHAVVESLDRIPVAEVRARRAA